MTSASAPRLMNLRSVLAMLLLAATALALPFTASGPARAAERQVAIADYAYGPATLTVPLGTTVTWTNEDTAPHDVQTSAGPATLDSPLLDQGEEWSYTFTTPGTYDYYCTVHPDMVARVVVEEAPPEPEPEPEPEPTSPEPAHGDHEHEEEPAQEPAQPEETPDDNNGNHGNHNAEAPPSPTASSLPSSSDAADPTGTPNPTATPTRTPTQVTAEAAGTREELDPLLIVAGVVTGIAVLCLLLAASRTATARRR
jgi:amicyanin